MKNAKLKLCKLSKSEGNKDLTFTPKKSEYQGKKFVFTLNNYTEEQICALVLYFKNTKCLYSFGKEIAPETGTPHLQGAFITKVRKRYSTIFKELGFNFYLHGMKGTWKDQKYTTKDGDFYTNDPDFEPLDLIKDLRKWQLDILDICNTKPNKRSINWIFDKRGNNGKTELCKYLLNKFDPETIYFNGGTANDISSQILLKETGFKYCFFNLTRAQRDKISFRSLECIKDGIVQSGKYEGGFKMFNAPHVFVFCNFLPKIEALSLDRWKIYEIIDNELIFKDINDIEEDN